MPQFRVTDSLTGKTVTVSGDTAPTDQEAQQIFLDTGLHQSAMPPQQAQPSAPTNYDYLAASPGGAMVQGAAMGAQELMKLPAHVAASISDVGGMLPNPVSQAIRSGSSAIDDWVAKQRANYQAARDKFTNPASKLWEAAGAAAPGMLAGAAVGAPALAESTMGNIASGAAQGGKVGALAGAMTPSGQGDDYWSQKGAQIGGGAAMGGLTGGLVNAGAAKMTPPPQASDIKARASEMYDAADKAGVIIDKNSFKNFSDDLQKTVAEEGISKRLHGNALGALQDIQDAAGNHITLKGVDLLRQNVGDVAATAPTAGERRLAGIMREKMDNYLTSLTPKDVISGDAKGATDALSQARDLWGTYKKTAMVEDLIDGAKNRSNFTASGFENGLRTEFRSLAQNNAKMRNFTPEEQDAIRTIVRGGPMDNFFRGVGRYAVRGPVTGMVAGAAERVIPGAGFALSGISEGARHMAQRGTMENIGNLQNIIRGGGSVPFSSPPPGQGSTIDPSVLRRLLQSGLTSSMIQPLLGQQQPQVAP